MQNLTWYMLKIRQILFIPPNNPIVITAMWAVNTPCNNYFNTKPYKELRWFNVAVTREIQRQLRPEKGVEKSIYRPFIHAARASHRRRAIRRPRSEPPRSCTTRCPLTRRRSEATPRRPDAVEMTLATKCQRVSAVSVPIPERRWTIGKDRGLPLLRRTTENERVAVVGRNLKIGRTLSAAVTHTDR